MAGTWTLHPQLEGDTAAAGDLPLSRVLVNNDANYPWIILVPRQADLVDLPDLAADAQTALLSEVQAAARALKAMSGYDKLNVAALGNMVPQLHVHVIARFRADAAWPHPVWGRVPRRPYEPVELDRFVRNLRRKLEL